MEGRKQQNINWTKIITMIIGLLAAASITIAIVIRINTQGYVKGANFNGENSGPVYVNNGPNVEVNGEDNKVTVADTLNGNLLIGANDD